MAEERTATGIVIKRNLDAHGTLQVYLLETGRIVNRAKLLQERTHTGELKRQLERLAPTREIAEEDVLRLCPKLTAGRKRQRREIPPTETHRGDELPDKGDMNPRGETKDTPETDEVDDMDQDIDPPLIIPTEASSSEDNQFQQGSNDNVDEITLDTDPNNTVIENIQEVPPNDEVGIPATITQESEINTEAEGQQDENVVDTPSHSRKFRRLTRKDDDR